MAPPLHCRGLCCARRCGSRRCEAASVPRQKRDSERSEDPLALLSPRSAAPGDRRRSEVPGGRAAPSEAALQALAQELDAASVEKHLWPGDSFRDFCLRFLRARRFDVAKAAAMAHADLAWRGESRPRDLLRRAPSDVLGLSADQMEELLPTWHQGYDRSGHPLLVQNYGRVRIPALLRATTMDRVYEYHIWEMELLSRLCAEQTLALGRPVQTWVILVDAASWDPRNLMYPAAARWAAYLSDVDANHYPERLERMIIINAPSVVNTFYSMLSYLLDDVTKRKIQIFDSNRDRWMPVLHELVDPAQLGPEFGGTGTCRFRESLTGKFRCRSAAQADRAERSRVLAWSGACSGCCMSRHAE